MQNSNSSQKKLQHNSKKSSDESNDMKPTDSECKITIRNLHKLGMIEEGPPTPSSGLKTWYLPPTTDEINQENEFGVTPLLMAFNAAQQPSESPDDKSSKQNDPVIKVAASIMLVPADDSEISDEELLFISEMLHLNVTNVVHGVRPVPVTDLIPPTDFFSPRSSLQESMEPFNESTNIHDSVSENSFDLSDMSDDLPK